MSANFLRVGSMIINVEAISKAQWIDSSILFIWFLGDERHERFTKDNAHAIWEALKMRSQNISPTVYTVQEE